MTTATVQEIKKELQSCNDDQLRELCLRLARYKKENKELLNYLLFEAHNEKTFAANVKEEMDELFKTVPAGNSYLIKKSLRKVLRFANRQIKYSGNKQTELEIRIHFCTKMKQAKIMLAAGTVLFNLYQQQIKKIESALIKLPEDIRGDYDRELRYILGKP